MAIDSIGTVVEWNRQAEQTFGWPRDEALGAELAELIVPPRSARRTETACAASPPTARAASSRRMELEAIHRNGHQFPVEITIWAAQGGSAPGSTP